jgi:hypothetical protein
MAIQQAIIRSFLLLIPAIQVTGWTLGADNNPVIRRDEMLGPLLSFASVTCFSRPAFADDVETITSSPVEVVISGDAKKVRQNYRNVEHG